MVELLWRASASFRLWTLFFGTQPSRTKLLSVNPKLLMISSFLASMESCSSTDESAP